MNCETLNERIADYLAGELSAEETAGIRRHLDGCPACREEVDGLGDIWLRLGLVPDEEPSERLRARFYAALARLEAGETAPEPAARRAWRRLRELLGPVQSRRLAIAAPSLALGLALGLVLSGLGPSREISGMREEVDSLTRLVTLSLLQQDSASDRLQGVSFGRRTAPTDPGIVGALIDAAIRDPSVNVRLAAIDALTGVQPAPEVRDRLEGSLALQESPLVQLAVIDYLLASQPTGIDAMRRRLLQEESLDEAVRQYLTEGLPRT